MGTPSTYKLPQIASGASFRTYLDGAVHLQGVVPCDQDAVPCPCPSGTAYAYIAGAATTVVKSGAGRLVRIVNNSGAGTSATIYDNTSAAGDTIGIIALAVVGGSIDYDLPFATGLTIVTVGAAADLTVVFQ